MTDGNFFLASILLACLLGSIFKAEAREVTPFNNGWEFKKGPFPTDAMQTAARWNADWEQVNVPHTWNADDMQKKTNSFYAGVAYYRKHYVFPESLEGKRLFLRFEGVGACAEVMSTVIWLEHIKELILHLSAKLVRKSGWEKRMKLLSSPIM